MRANMIAVLVAVVVLPSPGVLLVNSSVLGDFIGPGHQDRHAQLVIDLGNQTRAGGHWRQKFLLGMHSLALLYQPAHQR